MQLFGLLPLYNEVVVDGGCSCDIGCGGGGVCGDD